MYTIDIRHDVLPDVLCGGVFGFSLLVGLIVLRHLGDMCLPSGVADMANAAVQALVPAQSHLAWRAVQGHCFVAVWKLTGVCINPALTSSRTY